MAEMLKNPMRGNYVNTKLRFSGLTGNQLKLLALVLMTIDHIGAYLLPQYTLLRCIGRLAMPIFAWMIAEGCRYTRNRPRYLLSLLAGGILCQTVAYGFIRSLDMCILITFSLSVLLIYAADYAGKKKSFLSLCVMGAAFVLCFVLCILLPGRISGFRVDYGLAGVLLPVFIYCGTTKEQKLLLCAGGLALLAMTSPSIQWLGLLSVPLLALYNGKRGKAPLKSLFYIYYPAHLAVIYLIGWLLSRR